MAHREEQILAVERVVQALKPHSFNISDLILPLHLLRWPVVHQSSPLMRRLLIISSSLALPPPGTDLGEPNLGSTFLSKCPLVFALQPTAMLLWATVSLSSGFHPQSNGPIGWANQVLERTLWCLASQNPSSWSQQLHGNVHNSLPVSSI